MSTNTQRRRSGARGVPAATDFVSGPVSPALLRNRTVEQATDLGDGYVIVKIGRTRESANASGTLAAAVPEAVLRGLLERIVRDGRSTPSHSLDIPTVELPPQEDNRKLLDEMDVQAMARRREMHEAGLLLASSEICARLGITRQALSKAVKEKRMFWVDGPGGMQWYPSFFADGEAARRDIERVSVELGTLPGLVKWQFFTTPKFSLGGKTPIEALHGGALDQVLRAAAEFAGTIIGR